MLQKQSGLSNIIRTTMKPMKTNMMDQKSQDAYARAKAAEVYRKK